MVFSANLKAPYTAFATPLPGRWHLMSVMLSAASCLDWAAKLTGLGTVHCAAGGGGIGE
jgi:hypothetical protein